jgi:DNA topoisomerase IB
LGNTPAVCRRSYINPHVFTLWRTGRLQALAGSHTSKLRRFEAQVLKLLRSLSDNAGSKLS